VKSKITTLDIEASGIHPESYPIEIGILLPDGESYCSLIKPIPQWSYWDEQAEAVHGLSRQSVCDNGRSVIEVAKALNTYLEGRTVYCDCWVLDKPWLQRLFEAANIKPAFTLSDIIHLLSEQEYDNLGEVKQSIELRLGVDRHRATNDAKVLQLAHEQILAHRK